MSLVAATFEVKRSASLRPLLTVSAIGAAIKGFARRKRAADQSRNPRDVTEHDEQGRKTRASNTVAKHRPAVAKVNNIQASRDEPRREGKGSDEKGRG